MDSDTLIWIIVAVVVGLLVIGLLGWLLKKQKDRSVEQHRSEAQELRHDAHARTGAIHEADVRARETEAEADRARLEAERAERRASEAGQARAQEQAAYEDRIREADRLDPDVDHRADDYDPAAGTGSDRGATDATGGIGNGGVVHPEGATHNTDGTLTYPDGSLHHPDGTLVSGGTHRS